MFLGAVLCSFWVVLLIDLSVLQLASTQTAGRAAKDTKSVLFFFHSKQPVCSLWPLLYSYSIYKLFLHRLKNCNFMWFKGPIGYFLWVMGWEFERCSIARMKGRELFNTVIQEQRGAFVTNSEKNNRDRDPTISLWNPGENKLKETKLMKNSNSGFTEVVSVALVTQD